MWIEIIILIITIANLYFSWKDYKREKSKAEYQWIDKKGKLKGKFYR